MKIKKITLTNGMELTLKEAKELYTELDNLFKEKGTEYFPIYPTPWVDRYKQWEEYNKWPQITYSAQDNTGDIRLIDCSG